MSHSNTAASSASSSLPSVSCVSRSTVEGLNCPPLQSSTTHDVFQSVVKGRKSWKTARGGEVVWPPELEAALIEGLENYQPDDSRETRLLGRFPMRNRFISDFILEKTGKRRTAKQVGSRLQQLRDTCGGKKLLNLLTPIRRQYRTTQSLSPELYREAGPSINVPPSLRDDSDSCSDRSSASLPSTPTDAHSKLQGVPYGDLDSHAETFPRTIVYIDLLPDEVPDAEAYPCSPVDEHGWTERGFTVIRASNQPRRLREINPTITLLARSDAHATSYFTVYSGDDIVFSEATSLQYQCSAPESTSAHLHSTRLAPRFWERLLRSSDPTKYTIVQRVVEDASSSECMFSAMYKFNYPSIFSNRACYSSGMNPSSPSNPSFRDNARIVQAHCPPSVDLTFDCLLSMDSAEGFADIMGYEKQERYDLGPYISTDWDICSPTSLSAGTSSDYGQHSPYLGCDEEMRSPTSASFPVNISNYVL